MPPGVLNFVTGGGGTVGDTLVRHPRTRFVSFTGSKAVGIGINKLAAEVQPGQIWLKRVVAEMGGKDAIIVDEEADLDAAAQGVAAVGVRVPGPEVLGVLARDREREGLRRVPRQAQAARREDHRRRAGPVRRRRWARWSTQRARDKILSYIESGKQEGRLRRRRRHAWRARTATSSSRP